MIADKLSVFVSSTISECATEREAARKAIRSLNHEPILFEDVGARPYPPRSVYKPRLEASHVFIGIYRSSYGWVSPDMSISGLEDEYHIATTRGMDRLIYVFHDAGSREPRLTKLIEGAMASVTIAFFSKTEELYDRIRDDLTAVISNTFAGQAPVDVMSDSALQTLDALLPDPAHRVGRLGVAQQLQERLDEVGRLVILGPLGSGKTVLISQLSIANGWLFVDAKSLTRLEMLARCANALRSHLGEPASAYPTEQAARSALTHAWERSRGVTIAVDGAISAEALLSLPEGPVSDAGCRLLVSPRADPSAPSQQRFYIPPLTNDEIRELVTAVRGRPPEASEVAELAGRSAGNPLYLRFYTTGEPSAAQRSLEEVELDALSRLDGQGREIVTYLALGGRALSLVELRDLLGGEPSGIEPVADAVRLASVVLRQSRGSVDLVHSHFRETVLSDLGASPSKGGFFSSRLGDYLVRSGDFVTAFAVYRRAGDHRAAKGLLDRAAYQSGLRGGGRAAVGIFEYRAQVAREREDVADEVASLISLAQALRQTGDMAAARSAVNEAKTRAAVAGDRGLALLARECELDFDLQQTGSPLLVHELLELRSQYAEANEPLSAARIALLLTVEFIALSRFDKAAELAREAVEEFRALGDEYGIRVAQLNLASALSALPERRAESLELAASLEQEVDPERRPRERAIVCNLLTRRYRQLERYELAERYAREAIAIGHTIGEQGVVASNQINLGNVFRDQDLLCEALAEYRTADRVAAASGLRRQEAAANEVIASVLNQQREHNLALVHSQHAISVSRLTNDTRTEARAHEERAIALEATADFRGAVIAYVDGAAAIGGDRASDELFASLLSNALRVSNQKKHFDLGSWCLSRLFRNGPNSAPEAVGPGEPDWKLMCDVLPDVASGLPVNVVIPTVALVFSDLLSVVAPPIERQLVLRAVSRLASPVAVTTPAGRAAGVCGVLLASKLSTFSLGDLSDLAEQLCKALPGVYFKPHADGAAHWTVRLVVAGDVICTITQLDDSAAMAGTAMVVSLMLVGLAPLIRDQVLGSERLPRTEVQLGIVTHAEFARHIETEISGLGETLDQKFVIAESTDHKRSDQPPIVVICNDGFPERWRPTERAVSDVHLLFARILEAMTSHLFARAIERERLRPKLVALIRASASLAV